MVLLAKMLEKSNDEKSKQKEKRLGRNREWIGVVKEFISNSRF